MPKDAIMRKNPIAVDPFELSLDKEASASECNKVKVICLLQCLPLNRITLGQHKSDNNNRMIKLIDVFCVH